MESMNDYILSHRKQLGIALMILGVVPWLFLMGFIVYKQTPSSMVIGLTIFCWLIFFIGKTLFKEKPRPVKAANRVDGH